MKQYKVDFKYLFRMLGCAVLLALMLGMCGICSQLMPL